MTGWADPATAGAHCFRRAMTSSGGAVVVQVAAARCWKEHFYCSESRLVAVDPTARPEAAYRVQRGQLAVLLRAYRRQDP